MSNEVLSGEFTGKTTQEAIEEGLKALGITAEEAEIEVVEEAKKGFLGLGFSKAKVFIKKIVVEPEKTDAERTTEFLTGLFEILGLDVKIADVQEGEKIIIRLETEKTSDIIGKKGEILDSVQSLAGAVANIGREEYKRVVVDCEDYREHREEKLKRLAKKLADKAVAQGRKIKLEPMNPYDRRIVHATLYDRTDLKTQSEGKEPNRSVVIIPENLKPYTPRNKKNPYDKNKKPYRDDKRGGGERKFDRKKYETAKRNYEKSGGGSGTGTGLGNSSSYSRSSFKRSSASFFGTYLGNSKDVENKTTENNNSEE